MTITYHVQPSQRGHESQFGVFEQASGTDGWFIELTQFDSKSDAEFDAARREEAQWAREREAKANAPPPEREYCPCCGQYVSGSCGQ